MYEIGPMEHRAAVECPQEDVRPAMDMEVALCIRREELIRTARDDDPLPERTVTRAPRLTVHRIGFARD